MLRVCSTCYLLSDEVERPGDGLSEFLMYVNRVNGSNLSNQVQFIQSCNFINHGELFFGGKGCSGCSTLYVITSESTINLPIVTLDARLCSTGYFCLNLDNGTEEYPKSDEYGEYPTTAVMEPPPTHRIWALPVVNLDSAS